jgi:hypothetical protein
MCTSRTRGGKAITDSELEESLDDEEHDSADGTESRIVQYVILLASAPAATGYHIEMTWGVTEDGGGIASTFACFPFAIKDSAANNLFALMLILSTATLNAVTVTATVTAVFDMTTPEGVAALEGALVLGTMPALDACIVWVALVGTDFEGVCNTPCL